MGKNPKVGGALMHSIKHQIFSNWLLSCHVAQQCGSANRLSLQTCQCSSRPQYLLRGKLNPGLTLQTSIRLVWLFCLTGCLCCFVKHLQSKQIKIIMTTAKTLYGFLLLNDETEEKYPIDLEKPEPYLGFILSLH